ncbi:uncharacterized protein TNCV_2123451 [Trichonephila clavipes]|nr:uncharacterized protein TNCV_2123451 [Trichonephila clavipes]
MPRLQKVFKKRKGKYYPRKNTINSKVSTTDSKLNAQAEHAHDSKQSCAKEKKIPDLNESFSSFGDSVGILNAIMNLNILAFVFKNEVHCKMCNSGLDMQVLKGKSGLAITFVLKCFACPYRVEFSSSNFHEGTQIATINTRFVYAMRSIGKGAEAGRMFCGVMNLPQPPTRFSPYDKRILNAAKLVYEDSIQNAANHTMDQLFGEITAVFRICGKLSGPFFCISYQLMNIRNMVFVPSGKIHGVGFKKVEASGKSYKHKNSLLVAVVEAMRPIFRGLSHPDLLKKCLHGKTQNPNESFHKVIWPRVPKATFVQIETLSLGVYDAVCSFNVRNVSKLKMLQKMGVERGEYSVSAMKLLDRERLMKAIYAFSGRSKKIRKDKRKKERKKIILRKIR